MSKEKNETWADIAADIRERAENVKRHGDERPTSGEAIGNLLLSIADRIEGAAKRESQTVTKCNGLVHPPEKCTGPGNVAKLRKALFAVYDWILKAGLVHGYVDTPQKRRQLYDMMTKALAAKPRNCDVGKPWKQAERFKRFCESNRVFYRDMFGHDDEGRLDGWDCRKECPVGLVVDDHDCLHDHCELVWAQMPYDEKGGDK